MSRLSLRGPRWRAISAQVLERDNHQCQRCAATDDLTVDHIVPLDAMDDDDLDDGLPWSLDNLQTLCRSCNGRKSNRADDTRRHWLSPRWH